MPQQNESTRNKLFYTLLGIIKLRKIIYYLIQQKTGENQIANTYHDMPVSSSSFGVFKIKISA